MPRNNFILKPLTAAIIGLTASASATVLAQDNAENVRRIDQIIITGTRREGLSPTESLSPIDLIDGEAISFQAAFDLTDSLTKISPALNTQRYPIADGTAFVRPVTLRNLSPDHTLVLVNGTRRHRSALVNLQLSPLGTVNQGSQGVDFSAFPAGAIKRVEVLRDGASAQYGSDAIAGVINVVLNDADEGFSASIQHGEYFQGDGGRTSISANAGFGLGSTGFLNISLEKSASDLTSRGNARPDAAQVAGIVGAGNVAYGGLGQRWGDPDIDSLKAFVNAGFDLSDSIELYANASYMDNETLSGFFYRGPVLDPAEEFTARETLQTDTNGDFLPDNAPQILVSSIVGDGLNPEDYLVADATSPSGFVLRNPIFSQFPGGYSPLFGADISDYAFVLGARGETDYGLSWDVRGRIAENEVDYVLKNSINPSLGRLSPTKFNPGTLSQEESSVNADFVKTFDNSPINLGFGIEYRKETYVIGAGDPASISTGPTFAQFGVGSDGFQGFSPESAGDFESDYYAAYIDVETDITDELSAAVALRYEDLDGSDSTVDWKLSARYQFADSFAARATINTGFRTPTPGQINTLNVTTTSDINGNLIPSGTYPVDHPIASTLGATKLRAEESTSFTVGLVYEPLNNTTITLDYYNITIKDRLGLQNITVSVDDVVDLNAAGVPDANLLLGSNLNFFSNAFDSDIQGIDLAITHEMEVADGFLTSDLRHNYNRQEVSGVKTGTINQSRVFDLENQVPEHNSVLSFNYSKGFFDGLLRFNRYDDWKTTGGLFGPPDASDATSYDGAILVDIEARFNIGENYSIALGGENIFDKLPDDEANGVLQFLGVEDTVTSPYGFNGGFWYLRATARF